MTDKWIPKDVNRMSKPVYLQLAAQSIELTDSQSYTKEEIDKKLVSADMGNAYSLGGKLVYSMYTTMETSRDIPKTIDFDYVVLTIQDHQHPYYLTKDSSSLSFGLRGDALNNTSNPNWGSSYTGNATISLSKTSDDTGWRLSSSVDCKNFYYGGPAINAYFFKY